MDTSLISCVFGLLIIGVLILLTIFLCKKSGKRLHNEKMVLKEIISASREETSRISGKLELIGEPLTAPLSGNKCAYYHVIVECKVCSEEICDWKEIINAEISSLFGVRHGQYFARIESPKMEFYIFDESKYKTLVINESSEFLEEFLNHHGKQSEDFLGENKLVRIIEGVLMEGDMVFIQGRCIVKNAGIGEWSDENGKVLIIGPSGNMPVILSDESA